MITKYLKINQNKLLRAGTLLVAVIFIAVAWSPVMSQQYEVTAIGTLGGFFSGPTKIDNQGVIVGASTIYTGAMHAFRWEDNQLEDLGVPSFYSISGATGINSFGQIVGNANGEDQSQYAYLWEDGAWTALGTLQGPGLDYSKATGINDNLQICGYSFSVGPGSGMRAWIWEDSILTDLGSLSGEKTSANAINDLGLIVGSAQIYNPDEYQAHAFLWGNSVMTDLGVLPGEVNSVAYDINEFNQVVGASSHVQNVYPFLSIYKPCIWNEGQINEIMLPQGYATGIAMGINDNGTVVGSMSINLVSGPTHAFIWEDGVITNLNSLIPPGSGWWLQTAVDINESGQIAGAGIAPEGYLQGYLLTPLLTEAEDNPGEALPTDFGSLSNYPNPFNASTTIIYSLPKSSHVSIDIYDILGKRVKAMDRGTQDAGRHQITWKADDQPSGLYFYRITAGEISAIGKMALLK